MQDGITLGSLDHAGSDRFQRLRAELGVETFGLNLIRLAPRQRGRIHAHEHQEEVYVVLSGTLTVAFGDGEEEQLGPNACARVAPGVRRQLINRGRDRCVFLAMGGAEAHHGRDGIAFDAWDAPEGRPPAEVPLPQDLPV
jgi:mannose-6-phosphate isomerase-like protein (cupin superfamily)